MLTDYTLIVRKIDKRRKDGESVKKYDYVGKTQEWMEAEVNELRHRLYPEPKFKLSFVETYVTKKNIMSGKEFKERFDTPYYCSPSSETYWSM